MIKETKRKTFKFYRSYFDVFNELEKDKDKLAFIEAVFNKQFLGIDPELNGIVKFAYISQVHSIEKQVKGWQDATGEELTGIHDPLTGLPKADPSMEVQVKEEEKEKEERKKAFNSFWTKYPKKIQKNNCKDKFLKLKQSEIDIILNTIDNFLSYKPFKDYTHPNPITYLNQKRWNDEIGEVTKTEYSKFKRLHLTQVGTIRSQCREKPLLDILLKRCDCTAEEIHKYILFREDNNYLNTYEV